MTVGAKVKQTLSSLKSVKSTVDIYAAQSQPAESSAAFREAAEMVNGVISDLEKRVQKLEFEEPQYKGL